MKSIIILSGGLDSTTLLYRLVHQGKEVYAISFNYGQKQSIELELAAKTCKNLGINHKIVDISSIQSLINNSALTGDIDVPEGGYKDETMKSTVVPNRNMIFISLAIGYAVNIGAKEVAIGVHAGDHDIYPDCRPLFIKAISTVAEVSNYEPIEIYTPYLHFSKADIVKEGIELGVDYSLTWTCYKGLDKPCGKCGSCTERLEAFKLNNIKDPLEYLN